VLTNSSCCGGRAESLGELPWKSDRVTSAGRCFQVAMTQSAVGSMRTERRCLLLRKGPWWIKYVSGGVAIRGGEARVTVKAASDGATGVVRGLREQRESVELC